MDPWTRADYKDSAPLRRAPLIGTATVPVIGSVSTAARRRRTIPIPLCTGHVTQWHTDFQYNVSFQLTGSKRWSFARGEELV